MSAETRPSVLFVYFTYTGQTLKLVETMTEVLESRGCESRRRPLSSPILATKAGLSTFQ